MMHFGRQFTQKSLEQCGGFFYDTGVALNGGGFARILNRHVGETAEHDPFCLAFSPDPAIDVERFDAGCSNTDLQSLHFGVVILIASPCFRQRRERLFPRRQKQHIVWKVWLRCIARQVVKTMRCRCRDICASRHVK